MGLLKDTEMNHMSKLMFKWVYWNLLLAGVWLGPPELQKEGKRLDMIGKK
jgi:sulfide:quinone oxidoreductase